MDKIDALIIIDLMTVANVIKKYHRISLLSDEIIYQSFNSFIMFRYKLTRNTNNSIQLSLIRIVMLLLTLKRYNLFKS